MILAQQIIPLPRGFNLVHQWSIEPSGYPPPPAISGPPRPDPCTIVVDWFQSLFPQEEEGVQPLYLRRPYLNHKDRLGELEAVFVGLSKPVPWGGLSYLAEKLKIPFSTVQHWSFEIQQNPDWRSTRRAYAEAQRVFTDAEEYEPLHRITIKFLEPGLYFNDADFQHEAMEYCQVVIERLRARAATDLAAAPRAEALQDFKASRKFAQVFRKRHAMSLRRPSYKLRPNVDEEKVQEFIVRVQDILKRYPPDRVINIDETNWRMVPGGFLTWAKCGAEQVTCLIQNDEKFGVTAIAAVDALGKKLPLTVIGKGKTPRCLAGHELSPVIWGMTSESGWTTTDVMCRYLQRLHQEVYPKGPLCVILHVYAAHRSPAVLQMAANWGWELVFIPPGCTDRLQPLDRRVFGVLKSYARYLWRRAQHAKAGRKIARAEMAANLLKAWHMITPNVIDSAWDICWTRHGGDDGPGDGDDPHDPGFVFPRHLMRSNPTKPNPYAMAFSMTAST